MSQQTDASPSSSRLEASSPRAYTRPFGTNGGTPADRWKSSPQMKESRGQGSGELEGSTLGSSSRDGERGSRGGQRKIQGSSSFLLGSSFVPRSKTLKTDHRQHQHQHHHHQQPDHRPRHAEDDRREKRGTPEGDNLGSTKKKSRFSWGRHKHPVEEVSSEGKDTGSRQTQDEPQSQHSNVGHLEKQDENRATPDSQRRSIGLDQDSIQIVNLALDLSESRRTGNIGRSASHRASGGAWVPQSSTSYVDNHTGGNIGPRGRAQAHQRSATHSYVEDLPREQLTTNEPLPVSNLLPNQTEDPSLPQEISESTLARVAKTRRHFELLGEYLRLLPSLPPLGPNASASADGYHTTPRAYNPLQVIRNRKVRFREKCPINVEADGWDDVGAVHEWVSNITHQYSGQAYGPHECLRLPQLRQWQPQPAQEDHDGDALHATTSSPESGNLARRSSSIKARRPRFDWLISPAELLADSAWVEDGFNKAKMLNKDGNNLYPDPAELISPDATLDGSSGRPHSSSVKRVSLDVPSRPLFVDSHRSSNDYKKVTRGRSRHRGSSSFAHSSSASTNGTRFRHPSKVRSRSSSSVSVGPWMSERSTFSSPLSTKTPDERGMKSVQEGTGTPLRPPSKTSRLANYHEKPASISSASEDDLRNPSIRPSSPNQGFFPSMAIDLSPPSSRSPSPSKRHFSRRIVSKHERGKSKHDVVDEPEKEPKGQVDYECAHKPMSPDTTDIDRPATDEKADAVPPQSQVSPDQKNEQMTDETTPAPRRSGQYESKLRGIFKGKGKLAEKVGSEVSRMGDFIMKKDHPTHSRQSSFATSVTSEEAEDERMNNNKIATASKNLLRRLPALADESPRYSGGSLENTLSPKDQVPSQHAPLSQATQGDGHPQAHGESDVRSPSERTFASQTWFTKQSQRKRTDDTTVSDPGKFDTHISGYLNGSPGVDSAMRKSQGHGQKGHTKDPSDEKGRPLPVTGLAKAEPTPPLSSYSRRPTMSGSWTISERSIPTLADLGVFNKREIERTRALLLSSGIKAREITRRAETIRDPPEFLQNSAEPGSPTPKVVQLKEFDLASQNLDRSFKQSQAQFQQYIGQFPSQTACPLNSQLNDLENLVNNSLSPRVRSMGNDAETLIVSLNSKGPLSLKQLSDTLDKGVRKRRRRLRWVRRAGFLMLEWALVGMLWWVWLIVMAFKMFRGVFRGAISGVRWVLWL